MSVLCKLSLAYLPSIIFIIFPFSKTSKHSLEPTPLLISISLTELELAFEVSKIINKNNQKLQITHMFAYNSYQQTHHFNEYKKIFLNKNILNLEK